ncbi:hypothetical protein PSHI_48540 [Pseudomonas sp. URMO17WK12:I11]|nr:hypothetical protein PSHI_48540 [Pseudomonas sp. URMO17WK12:I11]
MQTAMKVNKALASLSMEEADFLALHRDEIETFLAQGATAIGIGIEMLARKLEDVKYILRDIELLLPHACWKEGYFRSSDFFVERERLLANLTVNLAAMNRKGIGFPDHPNLKRALGIPGFRLVHHWTSAGAIGQGPGYATHIEGVTKAAKAIKHGGWIGVAISGASLCRKFVDVCQAGSTVAFERVRFSEASSFTGGVVGTIRF